MHKEHFHLIRFALNKELVEMYISMGLRSLALAMGGIFIPLYLFKELGYSFVSVMWFYFIVYGVMALSTPLSAIVSSKLGLKRSILLSVPFSLIFIYLLNSLKYNLVHYSIVAIIEGISLSLFWIAFHTDFANFSDKKNRGKEVGIWFGSSLILSIIGPIVGGFLLKFYGFSFLFGVVSCLLIWSVVPLFFSGEKHVKYKFDIKKVFLRKNFKDSWGFISYGIEGISVAIFLPLFVFLILNDYVSLGIVSSIMGFTSVILIPIMGILSDKVGKKPLIKIGALLNFFGWIIVSFVKNFWQIIIVSGFGRLVFIMVDLPFSSFVYDKANKNKNKVVEYLVFREIILFIGRGVILLSVILFVNLFNLGIKESLILSFLITGLSSFAYWKI